MPKEIINLTPHTIHIYFKEAKVLTIPASGTVARCEVVRERVSFSHIHNGCVVYRTKYGRVQDLPDEKENTFLIVSMLVRQSLPERKDLFSPGELVRNKEGQPIGCQGLDGNL